MGLNKKTNKKVVSKTPATTYSNITAIVSDIHFPNHDQVAWRAFKKWVVVHRPMHIVVLGDALDMSSLSRFEKHPDSPVYVVPEIKMFVAEMNALLTHCGKISYKFGNHEARYSKKISEMFGHSAHGLKGLTLDDQLYAQGLDPKIKCYTESTKFAGLKIGQFLIRHGDKQAGRTTAKNIASLKLDRSLGESEIVGHHHVLQYAARCSGDRTAVVIVNPCMTEDHEYAVGANWQRGFTILEHVSQDWVTPFPVIIHKGKFSYSGKLYDGNKRA